MSKLFVTLLTLFIHVFDGSLFEISTHYIPIDMTLQLCYERVNLLNLYLPSGQRRLRLN